MLTYGLSGLLYVMVPSNGSQVIALVSPAWSLSKARGTGGDAGPILPRGQVLLPVGVSVGSLAGPPQCWPHVWLKGAAAAAHATSVWRTPGSREAVGAVLESQSHPSFSPY